VPALMWPSPISASTMSAEGFESAIGGYEEAARQYRGAAARMEQTTDGAFSETAIIEHHLLAVDHTSVGRILTALAVADRRYVELAHDLAARLDDIDHDAQQRISSSPLVGRPAIAAQAHKEAAAAHAEYTAAVARVRGQAENEVSPLVVAIVSRTPAPTDKPNNTAEPLDNQTKGRGENSEGNRRREGDTISRGDIGGRASSESAPNSTEEQHKRDTSLRGDIADTPVGPLPAPTRGTPAPASALSGGGIAVPGSGGLPGGGVGAVNSLSALTSGPSNVPGGASLSGLSGMSSGSVTTPSVPASGAAVDPGTFGRAVAAGAVSPVSSAPSLPGAASGASSSVGAGAVGAAPAAGSLPAGAATSAAHTPAPAAVPGLAPGGMMLPSPGIGGPAAPAVAGVASSGSTTVPATGPGAASGSVGSSGGVNAGTGATVVPASVVAAGRAVAERGLSRDVLAANQLAWELQAACSKVGYPIDWAVGVFRSSSGSEMVVLPSDGSGYVPRGVFLPRSARLLVSDRLVDKVFRDYWFGWADPGQILVAYGGLREGTGWRLTAAAATTSIAAFQQAGIEHGEPCIPQRSPLLKNETWRPPELDALHVHRLQLEYPDLYERLARITDIRLQMRLITPLGRELVGALMASARIDCPLALREVWAALMNAGPDPSDEEWARYHEALDVVLLRPHISRPSVSDAWRPEDVPTERHAEYRDAWLLARVMEHVAGWMWRPLPLADMVYAAAATRSGDIDQWLKPRLREIEDELARERRS
jgi:hypothetical protein